MVLLFFFLWAGSPEGAYGTGGVYETYYQNPPYTRSSTDFFHDKDCTTVCHYVHRQKDRPRGLGVSLLNRARFGDVRNVCSSCHTGTAPAGLVTPFVDMWKGGRWLFPGTQGYMASAHFRARILWPGAQASVSAYPRIQRLAFRGSCINCHNPHGQPDPNRVPPDSRPFPSKTVAGIDLVRVRDTGGQVNGLQGDGTGGYDSTHAEDLCYTCHDADGPARDQDMSGNRRSIKEQFERLSHHPVDDAEQSSFPGDPPWAWKVECTVCHNPHLAQLKSVQGSVVCLPDDNTRLWQRKLSAWRSVTGPEGKPLVYARPRESLPDREQMDSLSFCGSCHRTRCDSAEQRNDYQRLSHDPIPFVPEDCPRPINRHGAGAARGTSAGSLKATFAELSNGYRKNLYLACTDCHEPHGSTNAFLLRTRVNGVSGIVADPGGQWYRFCSACHEVRDHGDRGRPLETSNCKDCHNHGSENF